MSEQLPQSYYPSARILLIIRFDDPNRKRFNKRGQLKDANGKSIPYSLARGKAVPQLNVVSDPSGRLTLQQRGPTTDNKAGPQLQYSSDDKLTQVVDGIIPLRATCSLTGIRTAGTLSCEIAYADLPVDPRMVRGCGIEFYLGTVTADDFARGIAGEKRSEGKGTVPLNIIPKTYTDGFGRARTNLRFQGWVDSYDASWGEGIPTVKLECRDNTTFLIDTEAPPGLVVNAAKPIDRAFADYLAVFPQFAGLSVIYKPQGLEIPTLAKALNKTAYKPNLGPGLGSPGGSVWDYFTDLAGLLGHIVRFDGTTIIIQTPRSLYSGRFAQRDDDPYKGYNLVSSRALPYRLFVYGRNVASYSMKRKFSVAGPTTIEVRGYSTTEKRALVVRYPLNKDRLERGLPGNFLADEKINVYRYDGVKDLKTLRAIAQSLYEQIGRNEIELNVVTQDLCPFGGNLMDPTTLDCKPGDTIQFEINSDAAADFSTLNFLDGQQKSFLSAARMIKNLGYSDDFANTYGLMVAQTEKLPLFRVKRLDQNWDMEKGIDLSIQATNYYEVRGDSLPQGEEPDPKQTAEELRKKQLENAKAFSPSALLQKITGGG